MEVREGIKKGMVIFSTIAGLTRIKQKIESEIINLHVSLYNEEISYKEAKRKSGELIKKYKSLNYNYSL